MIRSQILRWVPTILITQKTRTKSQSMLLRNILSSGSERKRQIPYDITYIWNLMYSTDEPFHRKETHGLGQQTCGCQGGWGRNGMDWESGVNRGKLLLWNG